MKQYPAHRSKAAPASRTLGALAFALALVTLVTQRFDLLTPDTFVLSLSVAAGLAVAAMLCGLIAFVRIWSRGGGGIGSSILGVMLGAVALCAPAAVLGLLIVDPELTDVTTDPDEPPLLVEVLPQSDQAVLVWMASHVRNTAWTQYQEVMRTERLAAELQLELYPDIVPRRYRITPGELHAAAKKAVDELNWRVVDELPPDLLDAPTALWAEETTQLLGLKHDIALRVRPDPVGALLDVRSRSQSPLREFSGNADVIRGLMAEVDRVLLETYGDLERLAVEEADLQEDAPLEVFERDRETIPLPSFKPYFEDDEGLSADAFELDDLEG
jgi:hypothetical protein